MGVGILLSLIFSAQAGWVERSFQNEKVSLYLPQALESGQAGSKRFSLMLNLHGCAQRTLDLVEQGNWPAAAERNDMIVVVPPAPRGGVVLGCWDYYGSDQGVDRKHSAYLLQMIESLLADQSLRIDPSQIFVSGLSSGGGQAFLLACLRPDLIAGVGLNSAPTLGSGMNDLARPRRTPEQIKNECLRLAGSRQSQLNRLKFSLIVSDRDPVVNEGHTEVNLQGILLLIGATEQQSFVLEPIPGVETEMIGKLFGLPGEAPRVSVIVNAGLGHNWAAGPLPATLNKRENSPFPGLPGLNFPFNQGQGRYISHRSVKYPDYLSEFLTTP